MSTPLDLSEYNLSPQDPQEDAYATDDVIDLSSSEDLKYDSFLGLDLRTIHHSSENPLNTLYHQVLDSSLSLADRRQAFTYMYHSAYVNKDAICTNALLGLLKDETLSAEDRFYFLNSMRIQSTVLSVPMNGYVWWFYQRDDPIAYKLLAAQFILAHPMNDFPLIKTHFLQAQRFLRQVAEDETRPEQTRAEAADMLLRLGTPNFRAIGSRIISELGGLQKKTLYEDQQNVHQVSYQSALSTLFQKVDATAYSIDEILHHLRTQQNHDASDSLERIVLDTATYEGRTMTDVMRHIYAYIQKSPHKLELENRFIEELVDMKGWCSTGQVVRLLNTLGGFDSDITLTVDVEKEIKAAVFARLGFSIKQLSKELQEELANEFCSEEKALLHEFVETYSPYDELIKEYQHLPVHDFQRYYDNAVKEYIS
jgi:hypothetical protein